MEPSEHFGRSDTGKQCTENQEGRELFIIQTNTILYKEYVEILKGHKWKSTGNKIIAI